ncbi:hypothetical protein BGX28_006690 [Mortierella sp. GBA30]|nr:hypothetical protein BGX28_006690 [Mortierella sp. GBA30]
MQFKTLALATVALVAVNAQLPPGGFPKDACSDCTIASFNKDAKCAALPPADLDALKGAVFKLNATTNTYNPDVPALAALFAKPDTKACICDWASTAFGANGPASSCVSGTPPTCDSSQLKLATTGISALTGGLCPAGSGSSPSGAPSGSTPSGSAAPPAGTSTTPKAGAANTMNMPYVLTFAAVGLAALVGL